ncbi:MAG: PRC-barrel domain-containing protein [Thermofilum sp.]|jgi:sporulation protein YlmC with PRC-barrel domain|nr:PRC-barrel domain-containing protein [Thermofilum sp.]
MLLGSLLGKKVLTLDGVHVGEVEDLEVSESWKVEKLILRLKREVARELGIRLALRPRGAVKVERVRGVGDYITLAVEGSKLREVLEPL